jgi:hypothetical protein
MAVERVYLSIASRTGLELRLDERCAIQLEIYFKKKVEELNDAETLEKKHRKKKNKSKIRHKELNASAKARNAAAAHRPAVLEVGSKKQFNCRCGGGSGCVKGRCSCHTGKERCDPKVCKCKECRNQENKE